MGCASSQPRASLDAYKPDVPIAAPASGGSVILFSDLDVKHAHSSSASSSCSDPSPAKPTSVADRNELPGRIDDAYDIDWAGGPIGRGHFARVFKATHKQSGRVVAVKAIEKQGMQPERIEAEINLLRLVAAPPNSHTGGVVQLLDVVRSSSLVFLVFPFAPHGDLLGAINKQRKFSEAHAASIVGQLASTVAFLHSRGIVHRDIKPENLLLWPPDSALLPPDGPSCKLQQSPQYGGSSSNSSSASQHFGTLAKADRAARWRAHTTSYSSAATSSATQPQHYQPLQPQPVGSALDKHSLAMHFLPALQCPLPTTPAASYSCTDIITSGLENAPSSSSGCGNSDFLSPSGLSIALTTPAAGCDDDDVTSVTPAIVASSGSARKHSAPALTTAASSAVEGDAVSIPVVIGGEDDSVQIGLPLSPMVTDVQSKPRQQQGTEVTNLR